MITLPEIRVAVIGAGVHSQQQHIPSLIDHCRISGGKVRCVALCDSDLRRAEQVSSGFGFIPYFGSIGEVMEYVPVDGVIAVTPVEKTLSIVSQLLDYRVPLLVEKPPGMSLAESRELERLREAAGIPMMVSLNRRHIDCVMKLRQFIEHHPDGHIDVRFLRRERSEQRFLYDTAVHFLDTLHFLCGEVTNWFARESGEGAWSAVEFECQFQNGLTARAVIDPMAGQKEESYTYKIRNRVATARVGDSSFTDASVFRSWKGDLLEEEYRNPEFDPDYHRMGTFRETGKFLELIRGVGLPNPSLAEVLPLLAIAEALFLHSSRESLAT